MGEYGPPQGRVLRPQSTTSVSQLPGSLSRVHISPQVASTRYVKQFQTFMEHQRQTFDEERELWNMERMELHEKIATLEESLRRSQAISSSQVSSPTNNSKGASQRNNSFRSLLSKEGSNHTSAIAAGHEIWRGPEPDGQPTRTFSDPTTQSTKSGDRIRLPSIAEDTTCGRKDSLNIQSRLHKSSMSGVNLDKNFDGINFRSNTLSAIPTKKIMTPQSPSPRTSSPSRLSPRTLQLPSSKLEDPPDPYTKDAGHTPLARTTYFNADGAFSEGNGATPTQPEIERSPLEPHVFHARLPSERSDSYFPVVEGESRDEEDNTRDSSRGENKSRDEDPELKGPLGLDNSKSEDDPFLDELNSKLLQAARAEAFGPPGASSDAEDSPAKDEEEFEQPEDEPKLRIKRSMNFGSAFGAKTLGKGI